MLILHKDSHYFLLRFHIQAGRRGLAAGASHQMLCFLYSGERWAPEGPWLPGSSNLNTLYARGYLTSSMPEALNALRQYNSKENKGLYAESPSPLGIVYVRPCGLQGFGISTS